MQLHCPVCLGGCEGEDLICLACLEPMEPGEGMHPIDPPPDPDAPRRDAPPPRLIDIRLTGATLTRRRYWDRGN